MLGKHLLSMGTVSSAVSSKDGKSLDNRNCKQRGMNSKVEKIQAQQKGHIHSMTKLLHEYKS